MLSQNYRTALTETITNRISGLIGIWLYGSVAKGEETPESDLDIAFLAREPLPQLDRLELATGLMMQIGRDVDLVDLRTAPAVLRKEIIAHGRRIYCAEIMACETFEDFAFADYARLNEERAGIMEDIFERGSIHG